MQPGAPQWTAITATTTSAKRMPASSSQEATILPSLPPSPSLLEEVFSHPRRWSIRHEEFDSRGSPRSSSSSSPGSHVKGKGKHILEGEEEDEDDEDTQHRVSTRETYPPTTDEVAETRRVEETLKRWELAERQRRKSARESTQHTSGPSLFSSVTRTAGFVLSGRTASTRTSIGPGGTRAFKSHASVDVARGGYGVPLDEIDNTRLSADALMRSPSPSVFDRGASLDEGTGTGMASRSSASSGNPFVHPSESIHPRSPTLTPVMPTPTLPHSTPPSPSPFAVVHGQQALQATLTTRPSVESKAHAPKRPTTSGVLSVLLPRLGPLDLPPPPENTPQVTPLQPTPQPALRPLRHRDSEERGEVRWWHEWLCGCGEGPDRGGDNQAARTNPFE